MTVKSNNSKAKTPYLLFKGLKMELKIRIADLTLEIWRDLFLDGWEYTGTDGIINYYKKRG